MIKKKIFSKQITILLVAGLFFCFLTLLRFSWMDLTNTAEGVAATQGLLIEEEMILIMILKLSYKINRNYILTCSLLQKVLNQIYKINSIQINLNLGISIFKI